MKLNMLISLVVIAKGVMKEMVLLLVVRERMKCVVMLMGAWQELDYLPTSFWKRDQGPSPTTADCPRISRRSRLHQE